MLEEVVIDEENVDGELDNELDDWLGNGVADDELDPLERFDEEETLEAFELLEEETFEPKLLLEIILLLDEIFEGFNDWLLLFETLILLLLIEFRAEAMVATVS